MDSCVDCREDSDVFDVKILDDPLDDIKLASELDFEFEAREAGTVGPETIVPEGDVEITVVDEAELEVLDVIDSLLVAGPVFEDIESVVLGELEISEGSDFDISVCTDETDELILFEEARIVFGSADGTVSVKACVVVVPPGKVVEESGFEDNSDVFANEDSPATLECEAVDAVETLDGWVGLLCVFDATKLIGSIDFEVIVLEAIAVFGILPEASIEVFEDSSGTDVE